MDVFTIVRQVINGLRIHKPPYIMEEDMFKPNGYKIQIIMEIQLISHVMSGLPLPKSTIEMEHYRQMRDLVDS